LDQGWVLLCQFIGVIAGAWVGAYIHGRGREAGRQAARKQYTKEIIQQALDSAHAQEKGKRLATHEDIENVLKELNSVTKLTESIKTQFSREEWDRQELVNQRRTIYAAAFKNITTLMLAAPRSALRCTREPESEFKGSAESCRDARTAAEGAVC
jgi:hypothetical protein